ncbi:MAG: type IV pilus modification PilV family protein [Candidatus Aminicenantia bacterium]
MKEEKGFTLIEVLVSLAIFVLLIITLFQLVLLAMRTNVITGKRNNAVNAVFVEAEKIKVKRFEDIQNYFTQIYQDGTFYFVQTDVNFPPTAPGLQNNQYLKEIKIGVYWGMEYPVGYYGSQRKDFNQCMIENQNIEQCKNIAHHSYEYTFYVAEAL